MQFASVQKKPKRIKKILLLAIAALILAALVFLAFHLLSAKPESKPVVSRLPCSVSDQIKPFGKYVLYYDGLSIHCMTVSGIVRWSFQIGSNGSYDCDDSHIVAWSGANIYVIDQNGSASYNDNLGSDIQFARVGQNYVAAVIGETTKPQLQIRDLTGSQMDTEIDAYDTLILLDMGFFGSSGQYMWTLALDVFETAANTVFNTYEVGKMNTGEISLGDTISYKVFYDRDVLRVIGTQKIRTFSERGVEDTSSAYLVYGWHYLDREQTGRSYSKILFAPVSEVSNGYAIQNLRLLQGNGNDTRYSLPETCLGAMVYRQSVFAVSGHTLYRASQGETRFTSWELPLDVAVTECFGKLSSGYIIISAGNEVYTLSLPVK